MLEVAASMTTPPHSPPVSPQHILKSRFGLDSFRPGQERVIDAVMAGTPCVVVMPTGAGKSLCYQLPALACGGTTLVVSPLVSLMKDQADRLQGLGINAAAISGGMRARERMACQDDLARGMLELVYVAPERFKNATFMTALSALNERKGLTLLAIDEAHCISQWGHDFRPDYLRLGELVQTLKPPRLVALTATATPEVRDDIVQRLKLEAPMVTVQGFDRPNLALAVEVLSKGVDKDRRLKALVAKHLNITSKVAMGSSGTKGTDRRGTGTAIVYAGTRRHTEDFQALLSDAGFVCGLYHAGLSDTERRTAQENFTASAYDVIVATNAFGMGIDKSDIRLVVHVDLPRSPEAYYQEVGRAGRDGDAAAAVLLFQPKDVKLQEFLIDMSCPSVELLRQIWKVVRATPMSRFHIADELPPRTAGGKAPLESAIDYLLKAGYLYYTEEPMLRARDPRCDNDGVRLPPLDAKALAHRASTEHKKLRNMVRYAYGAGCRRRYLLDYFGDEQAADMGSCGSCDVCDGSSANRSLVAGEVQEVRSILYVVSEMDGRFGKVRFSKILRGAEETRFGDLETCGALAHVPQTKILDLMSGLEGAGYLYTAPGEYPTLSISHSGRAVLAKPELLQKLQLAMPERSKARRTRGRL